MLALQISNQLNLKCMSANIVCTLYFSPIMNNFNGLLRLIEFILVSYLYLGLWSSNIERKKFYRKQMFITFSLTYF